MYYKILAKGHTACHGGTFTYRPNRWTKRITDTRECRVGYHVCDENHIAEWLYAGSDSLLPLELWECEAEGVTPVGDKYVCERIKLTRLVGTLDEYDLRWLGTEFAIMALPNIADPRVGECINTVRAYSLGFAGANDLSAARSAAWSAAESAAWSAARSAAESAAWSAAESAARSAAWSAAWSAARSAAESAASRIVLDYLEA